MSKHRYAAAALILAGCLFLSGCGRIFEKEYVAEMEVPLSVPDDLTEEERTIVKNRTELLAAIRTIVSSGETESRIQFDAAYDGNPADDLAAACWRVRTEDALCAYCVENISYELSKIVSYSEAVMKVSYADAGIPVDDILRQSYTAGLGEVIASAIESGTERLAILIQRSTWSEEDMRAAFQDKYQENPGLAPAEPTAIVTMFSGSGTQRLYDIELVYPFSHEEFKERKAMIEELDPFAEEDLGEAPDAQKAYLAARYLVSFCEITAEAEENSVYSALISGSAGETGASFAYVELCRRLGLDCRTIFGQRDWEDRCWNIVKVDGEYYHVDLRACQEDGMEAAFLCSDNAFWGSYRWNTAMYPKCSGTLQYSDLAVEPEAAEEG